MTEKNEKAPLTRKEQLEIEGYKALMQYGVQLSQDHLNYDRIFMPLTFVPAYFVLTSLDVREAWLASRSSGNMVCRPYIIIVLACTVTCEARLGFINFGTQ